MWVSQRVIYYIMTYRVKHYSHQLSSEKFYSLNSTYNFLCLEEFTIYISKEKFEPELGFETRISISLAWRS